MFRSAAGTSSGVRPSRRAPARCGRAQLLAALCSVLASLAGMPARAANITSTQTGNWNVGTTWVGGVSPVAGDNVTIASTHTVTVTANAAAATITLAANASGTNGITINSGILLNASGAITMTAPTAGTSTISVGAGTLNAASIAIPGSATAGRNCAVTVSTGTITITGSVTFSGTAAQARFTSTGASTVNVAGNFGSGGTLTTSSTGTFNFNGGVAQTIGTYTTFNNMTINNTSGGVTLTGTTTFGGALTVTTGTLTVGAFTLTVTGATSVSGTLAITSTTGTKTFGDIVVNTGGVMSFSAAENITANGNLQVDGTGTISGTQGTWTFQKGGGGGTISGTASAITLTNATFTTTYTVSIPSTVTGTLTVTGTTLTNNSTGLTVSTALSGTGGLTQGTGATLNIGGTSAITTLTATANPNTVNYSGAAQTVKAVTYHHLTLSGSGTKTMPGSTLTLNADFTMLGTASATALAAVNTAGNFAIGGSNTFTTGSFTHDVKGNFTNSGTFTATGSTITLTGTGGQAIGGATTTTFVNLTVSKSSGTVTVSTTFNVSGVLTFTSGNISTGANTVAITSTGSVTHTSGHVVGNLQKNVATGANVSRTFEIGDATNYTPLVVVFASVSVSGNLTAGTTTGDHPNIATSDINSAKSVNRYWTLTGSGGLAFTNYGATFNFVSGDVDAGTSTATFVVRRWSGAAWSTTTIGTLTPTSTQITGQSTTGDFQIGNVLSVAASNSVFAFGAQPLNTWLAAQSSVITNDGVATETLVAQISTFTSGANTWTLSAVSNGADQVRAQWSTTSASGPWTDISAYATNFTIASSLAASGTVTFYLRIQTPISTTSTNQYSSTLTVTAQ